MSRRRVPADEPGCSWDYGWDPPRQTFYAELVVTAAPAEGPLVRYGTGVREVLSVDVLMYLMGVRLSDDRVATLHRDRACDSEEVDVGGDRPPTRRRRTAAPARDHGSVRIARPPTMAPEQAR
jgi:hypothetical protein